MNWKKFSKKNDGLAVFKNGSGAPAERTKKYFQKIFHKNDLNIVTKYNLKIINYLSVTLNLLNNTYKLFLNLETKSTTYVRNLTTYAVYNQTSTFLNQATVIKSSFK